MTLLKAFFRRNIVVSISCGTQAQGGGVGLYCHYCLCGRHSKGRERGNTLLMCQNSPSHLPFEPLSHRLLSLMKEKMFFFSFVAVACLVLAFLVWVSVWNSVVNIAFENFKQKLMTSCTGFSCSRSDVKFGRIYEPWLRHLQVATSQGPTLIPDDQGMAYDWR